MPRYEVDGTSARAPEEDGPLLHLVKKEISPDTVGRENISPEGSKKRDPKIIDFDEARKKLRGNEVAAADENLDQGSDDLVGVKKKESDAAGFYSGSGKGMSNDKEDKGGKRKSKGWLKKGLPVGAIFATILGIGGLMGGAQFLQPFSLVAQFQETFNSMHISASTRSNVVVRYQMDHNLVKNPIRSKVFDEDTFKITDRQASRLAAQGIEYDDDFDGNGTRVLKYDSGDGEIKIIAADDTAAARLTSMDLSRFDTGEIKYNPEAISFRNMYETNTKFFDSYNNGSMTWRGTVANWFGTMTENFFRGNKLTRNLFKNFEQDVAESDESPRKVATDLMAKNTDEIEEGGVKVATTEEDENGNFVRIADENGEYSSAAKSSKTTTSRSSVQSDAEVKAKLEKIGDDYSGGSVTGTAQKVVNSACIGLNFLGGVSLLVSASEALQIINLTTGYFEAIDKVKAGDGVESPINTLIDALNEKKTNTNAELASNGVAVNTSNVEANIDGGKISTLETKTTTTTKSAMESEGISALYSGTKVNTNDPSVQSFNFTGSIKRVLGGIGVSMGAFKACSFAKLAANAAGVVQSGIEIATCIISLFGGATAVAGCAALIGDIAIGAMFSVGIAVLISGIIATITPVVANALTRDLITNLGGEDLGNALTSGGNMYLGNVHRSNGGSLASEGKYTEYSYIQQQVIAEDARQERLTKNPFDATSKYTFMGTLLTQMMAFSGTNSLASTLTSASSVMSSAIVATLPSASAYNIAKTLPNMDENASDYYGNTCPYLASIGAVGDAFCNPYSMTDMSTIQYDPSEVTNILDDNFLDSTTSDGNVKIRGDSDLAKYILFCDNRNSAFGIADQNIVNQVSDWGQVNTSNSTINNVINSAIGSVPIVGDFIDVVGNGEALANAGYVSGESCVAGNTVSDLQAPNWEKSKYYQRFIEDQALMETMGIINESAVTAFLNEYYEENPLDNSYEGILARYSGLDKDTVVALLDVMDYVNYIANYNPSERYAFGEPAVEIEKGLLFDNENVVAENVWVVLVDQISYADVRNRTFAV